MSKRGAASALEIVGRETVEDVCTFVGSMPMSEMYRQSMIKKIREEEIDGEVGFFGFCCLISWWTSMKHHIDTPTLSSRMSRQTSRPTKWALTLSYPALYRVAA